MNGSEQQKKKWNIEDVWNDVIQGTQRDPHPREHIWAGEIGKNHYERYLKMTGVVPTNPPNDRVMRKFSAGNWFNDQIGYILQRIGIMQHKEKHIRIAADEHHLEVTGRIDYVAGGIINWTEARLRVESSEFPDFIKNVSMKLIDRFEAEFPSGLSERTIEVKSVNSQVFWAKKDYLQEAYPFHTMQCYTYLRAEDRPDGEVLYISKDDLTIKEFPISYPDPVLEKAWEEDVRLMTQYIRTKTMPPKPDDIIFDPRKKLNFQWNKVKHQIVGCYDLNWEIEWSNYFTLITGCKTPDDWYAKHSKTISAKNEELKDAYKIAFEKAHAGV